MNAIQLKKTQGQGIPPFQSNTLQYNIVCIEKVIAEVVETIAEARTYYGCMSDGELD